MTAPLKKKLTEYGKFFSLFLPEECIIFFPDSEKELLTLLKEAKFSFPFLFLPDGIPLFTSPEQEKVAFCPKSGQPLEWHRDELFLMTEATISLGKIYELFPAYKAFFLPYPETFFLLSLLRKPGLTFSPFFLNLYPSSFLSMRGFSKEGISISRGTSREIWTSPLLRPLDQAPSFFLLSSSFFPLEFSLLLPPPPLHQALYTSKAPSFSPSLFQKSLLLLLEKTLSGFFWSQGEMVFVLLENYPDLLEKKRKKLAQTAPCLHLSEKSFPLLKKPYIIQGIFPLRYIPALISALPSSPFYIFPLFSLQRASLVMSCDQEESLALFSCLQQFSPLSLSLYLSDAHCHH